MSYVSIVRSLPKHNASQTASEWNNTTRGERFSAAFPIDELEWYTEKMARFEALTK